MTSINETTDNAWNKESELEVEVLSQERVQECNIQQINPLSTQLADLTKQVHQLITHSSPILQETNWRTSQSWSDNCERTCFLCSAEIFL